MATGRMINKALFTNIELGDFEIQIRYFYVGLIVNADDDGRMKANPKFLKATIFPFDFRLRLETLQEWLGILSLAKLLSLYAVGGQEYLQHPNWKKWQLIRSDRYKPSDCPPPENGEQFQPLTEMTTSRQPDDNQMTPQPNLTKPNQKSNLDKLSSEKPLPKETKFQKAYNLFCASYLQTVSKDYIQQWGKDAKLFKGVEAKIESPEIWENILENFFKDSFAKKAGYGFGVLISQINKYNV